MRDNLLWATRAVEYVGSKMTIGASNQLRPGAIQALVCRSRVEEATRQRTVQQSGAAQQCLPYIVWLRNLAANAEREGCGNCAEQSAIAFIYLYDRAVRPLDYIMAEHVDHGFVVIGRTEDSDPGDYGTWGSAAVVCDPWHGKAYPAEQIPTEMYAGPLGFLRSRRQRGSYPVRSLARAPDVLMSTY